MTIRIVAILAAFLGFVSNAEADFNGVELQKYCADHSASAGSVACLMYIQGYVSGINAGDGSKEKKDRLWCFPEGATVLQARLIVEKYLRDNPQGLHQSASLLVGIALLQAFPCPNELKSN